MSDAKRLEREVVKVRAENNDLAQKNQGLHGLLVEFKTELGCVVTAFERESERAAKLEREYRNMSSSIICFVNTDVSWRILTVLARICCVIISSFSSEYGVNR